jgi:hypothetical protein
MVYILEYWEESDCRYEEAGYYATAKLAIKAAQREEEDHRIRRRLVLDSEMSEEEERELPWGEMCLNKNQECTYLYCSDVKEPGEGCRKSRFEDAYIDIPYPFKNGDRVHEIGNDLIGVVYDKGYENTRDSRKKLQAEGFIDYSDCTLVVNYPDENVEYVHDHVRITRLEYAELSEDNL